MAFWQWLGLAVAAAMLCLVVRVRQPEMAGICAIVTGGILLLSALESVEQLRALMDRLAALGGLQADDLGMVLKVLGMSYATELAAQTCEDLGENGLALKVGMAGKLCMFSVIAPVLIDLLEMIVELVP
ncbi:MAG: hypothetical protein E7319_08635 [Clostridiales bacterium]|nr:hypothetical protein [Clostridiales bacterium]